MYMYIYIYRLRVCTCILTCVLYMWRRRKVYSELTQWTRRTRRRRRKVNSKLTQWTRRDYHFDRHSLCHTPIETHTYVHICTYTRMYVCIQTYDAKSKDTYIMLGAASWRLVLFTHKVHLASALNESVCLFPNQSLCLSLPVIQTCLPYSLSGERQTKQIPHARERERERERPIHIHVAKETYSFIQRDLLRELMRLEQQPTRFRV